MESQQHKASTSEETPVLGGRLRRSVFGSQPPAGTSSMLPLRSNSVPVNPSPSPSPATLASTSSALTRTSTWTPSSLLHPGALPALPPPSAVQALTTSAASSSSTSAQSGGNLQAKNFEVLEILDFTDPSIFSPAGKHPPTASRAARLIVKLKADLNALPAISDRYDAQSDIPALQSLVYIAARHAKATKAHWNEVAFQEHLFELVMDKLPASAMARFWATVYQDGRTPKKKLPDARTFLADFLVEIAVQQQAAAAEAAAKATSTSAGLLGQLQQPPIYCSYCKELTNHTITDCVKLTKRLCLNCFTFGHSSKFCKAPEAFPLEGTYYLMKD